MYPLIERLAVAAATRSWRVYTSAVFTAAARVDRETFRIPVRDGLGLRLLRFSDGERAYIQLLRSLLADRPGTVVDVGANIGRWMLLVADIDRTRPYVGFEVHVACAHYVRQLVKANALRHHTIVPVGLGDQASVLMLQTSGETDVSASMIAGHYPAGRFAERWPVPIETGDRMLAGLDVGRVALLKIDTEGAELEVVTGLTDTIARDRPILIVEVAPYQHWIDGGQPEVAAFRRARMQRLEAMLTAHGYTFARITQGGTPVDVPTLDPGTSTDTREMDYLCRPTP